MTPGHLRGWHGTSLQSRATFGGVGFEGVDSIRDGRNPEEVLAYAMAEPSGFELFGEFMEDPDDDPPPRPRRKR